MTQRFDTLHTVVVFIAMATLLVLFIHAKLRLLIIRAHFFASLAALYKHLCPRSR